MGIPGPQLNGSAMTRLTAATAIASASHTPTTGDFLIAYAYVHTAGATAFTNTATCAGNGQTWTKRVGVLSADAKQMLMMFTAGPVASPSAGATTITINTAASEAHIAVARFAKDARNSLEQTTPFVTAGGAANAAGTSFSVSGITALSDKSNGRFMCVGHLKNEVTAPNANFTELGDSQTAPATGTLSALEGQYLIASDQTTLSATWVTNVVSIYGYVEIKNGKALGTVETDAYDDTDDTTPQSGSAQSEWNEVDSYQYRQAPYDPYGSWG